MQIVRLVSPGKVDRIMGFDTLPEDLLKGASRRKVFGSGLPRHWANLSEYHYCLDYITTNNDKEIWAKIKSYVMQKVQDGFRVSDHLEEMAKPMALSAKDNLSIEPEDVVIVPLKPEIIISGPVAKEKNSEPSDEDEKKGIVQTDEREMSRNDTKTASRSNKDRLRHTCPGRARRGVLADVGFCQRCDQIRGFRERAA